MLMDLCLSDRPSILTNIGGGASIKGEESRRYTLSIALYDNRISFVI